MELLTIEEAAAVTRRHENTLYKALKSGALAGAQSGKGGRWLIPAAALNAWIGQDVVTGRVTASPGTTRAAVRRAKRAAVATTPSARTTQSAPAKPAPVATKPVPDANTAELAKIAATLERIEAHIRHTGYVTECLARHLGARWT